MLYELSKLLGNYNFKNIVISNSLQSILDKVNLGEEIVFSEDPRSMVYLATGICAETKEPVAVICKGSNESRSAYSGLTEAYYRKLPILFITIGNQLNYSREIKDCCIATFTGLDSFNDACLILEKKSLPVHLLLDTDTIELACAHNVLLNNNTISILKESLSKDHYLFVSQSIDNDFKEFKCKVVTNKACVGLEGCLSNVLGASLVKMRKRYIGLLSEIEFLHDMNTLGNINANDLLLFMVVCGKNVSFIQKYASSLGYYVKEVNENFISIDIVQALIGNNKKSVLIIKERGEILHD